MAWPNSYDNLTHVSSGAVVQSNGTSSGVNNQSSAINALETYLGLSPQTGYATVAEALLAVQALLPAAPIIGPGTMYLFAAAAAPAGYLLCDGSSYSTALYPALFTAIGYTYGGSGGNFNVPNMQGKVPMGTGQGPGLSLRTLGVPPSTAEVTHTLTLGEMPTHSHTQTGVAFLANTGSMANQASGTGFNATSTAAATGTIGGGGAHNNLQPYLVLNFIIKT